MKRFFSLVSSLALVLSMGTPAMATYSQPVAVAADVNLAGVYNDNLGQVCNFAHTRSNSGLNDTTKGASFTGGAYAGGGLTNGVNANDSTVLLGDGGFGPVAMNSNSMFHSFSWSPTAVAVDANIAGVINLNEGYVSNFVMTSANTGGNHTGSQLTLNNFGWGFPHPMPSTSSHTGNAYAVSSVANTVNTNISTVGVFDSESGPTAVNMVTQPEWNPWFMPSNFTHGGTKLAVAVDVNVAGVLNLNEGYVNNFVMTDANSGLNHTTGTSGTGSAVAVSGVSTTLNTNDNSVFVTDESTGPVAVNSDKSNFGSSIAVAADANLALGVNLNTGFVKNMVATNANSGSNTTDKGNSSTGNASSSTSVTNEVNNNTTDMVVVDTSTGAVAQNTNQTGDSACQPSLPCGGGQTGGTSAANVGVSGTAVAVDVTAAVAVNDNQANVTNVTNTDANTGNNDTSGSFFAPAVTSNTGDAGASTTVSNTVNTNTTSVVIIK